MKIFNLPKNHLTKFNLVPHCVYDSRTESQCSSAISAANITPVINSFKFNCFKNRSCDTFERMTPVNSDKSFKAFKDWGEKTDLYSNIYDITNNSENLMGEGTEGGVYAIPGNDNWVIKTLKKGSIIPVSIKELRLIEIKDLSPELNIGQPVAEIQIPFGENQAQKFTVLKKQKGEPLGVPSFIPYPGTMFIPERVQIRLDKTTKLANAPQSTYDKCIKDTSYITSLGYTVDYGSANNFLLDTENQSINFIDLCDKIKPGNQYSNVLLGLLDDDFGVYYSIYGEDSQEKDIIDNNCKIIIKKYIKAMENNNVKFADDNSLKYILSFWDSCHSGASVDFIDLIEYIKEHNLCE